MSHFTNEQKLKAALREVAYRRRVYDRLVAAGKMTRENANKGLFIMQEIANDYELLAKGDRLL